MFGHHDDDQPAPPAEANADQQAIIEGATNAPAIEPEQADRPSGEPASTSAGNPAISTSPTIAPDPATTTTSTSPAGDPAWQHPGAPIGDGSLAGPQKPSSDDSQDQINDVISPAGGFPKHPTFSNHAPEPESDDSITTLLKSKTIPAADTSDQELIEIRQKALTELRPIVDKLDLPPEDKFRTIMMIIQVSDDEALVKAAYKAAHAITDDKDRAQALLDIVNEVNYFTHQPDADTEK